MKLLLIFYILNATLLLLHEMESAYEKEWEFLKLPGKLTGFLLMHIPIIFFLFYGALTVERGTALGYFFALTAGLGGILPFVVHKVLVRRKEYFQTRLSYFIIYANMFTGIITVVLSARFII